MVIKTKKEKILFENYFKTIEELSNFIKEKNEFINPVGILEKISLVYESLKKSEEEIKSSVVDWRVIQEFNFKFKRPIKLEFWEERGFGLKEFNYYVSKTKIGNNQFAINKNKGIINDFDQENYFEYGEFNFKQTGKPKCNFCQHHLILSPAVGKYVISACENKNCASHKNTNIWFIRQLAFLPKVVFMNKNKRLDLDSKVYPYYWLLNGFDYDNSLKKIENIKKELLNIPINSVQYYKILFGISEAEARIKVKQNSPISKDYLGYKNLSDDEIKNKISLLQKENANKFVLKKENNPELYSAYTPSQVYYWINKGLSIEDAKLKQSERQSTFSLEKCIEKDGEEKGRERWTQRQNLWKTSLIEGGNLKSGFSKISQELFYELLNSYSFEEKIDIHFATKNIEYFISLKGGEFYQYDFVDKKRMKIIEYNGDSYHGNPAIYSENDRPNPFRQYLTAQDIWDRDKRKKEVVIEKGFDVLTIWDSEYKKDKQGTIKKCLEFLQLNKND